MQRIVADSGSLVQVETLLMPSWRPGCFWRAAMASVDPRLHLR